MDGTTTIFWATLNKIKRFDMTKNYIQYRAHKYSVQFVKSLDSWKLPFSDFL